MPKISTRMSLTKNNDNIYTCLACGRTYMSRDTSGIRFLKRHIEKTHNGVIGGITELSAKETVANSKKEHLTGRSTKVMTNFKVVNVKL